MKKFKKLPFKVLLLSMIIGLLLTISIGFSIWLITDRIEIQPNLEVEKVITQYLSGQKTEYEPNVIQLPGAEALGWSQDSTDLTYSFQTKNPGDEIAPTEGYTLVTDEVGPIDAGTYWIKVEYQYSTEPEATEEVVVSFIINKATIDMKNVKFKDVNLETNEKVVTYNRETHKVEIDETTLPKEITGVAYKLEDGTEFTGAVNATESPYTVIASFTYNTANYNIVDDMTATLIINRKDINDEDILKVFLNYPDNTFYYTGNDLSEIESSLTVSFDKYVLTQNKEYTVSFIDILEVGDYTETIIGIGNYTGEATISYKIVEKQLIISISEDSSIYNAQFGYYFFDYTKGGVNFNKFIKIYNSQNEEITDAKISYKYKIDDNKPEFEDGFPINVGYYWVEITAAHKDYENCTEKKQFIINSLDISKAIITVSTDPKIEYNGSEQRPIYTVTYDGEPLTSGVDFSFVRWVDNINAGKASVIIQGKGNFDTNTECSGEFTIHKATPTIILTPTLSKKKLIEGENVEITENSGKATHNNIEVPGNFTSNVSNYITTETNSIIPMLSFPEDEKAASAVVGVNVTFKFTPNDTRNYEIVTIQNVDIEDSPPTYTMYAVAKNGTSGKYYGTIEKALSEADGENVWVLPDIYTATGYYPTIRTTKENKTVTVKKGVTLILSYAGLDETTSGYKIYADNSKGTEDYAGDAGKDLTSSSAAQALVAEGMILKVESGGTLTIGAWVGANSDVGKHAVLMNKGTINLENGGITHAYGFIKGTGVFNANSGSTVYDLMMIHDFAGARYAGGMYYNKFYYKNITGTTTYNNIMPFQSYSMHNISCETNIYKGSTYYVRTQLNISNVIYAKNIVLFGTGGMFHLTSDNGYVKRTVKNTTGNININGENSWQSDSQDSSIKEVYDFHSNVTDNSISVKITIAVIDIDIVSGKDVAMPIGLMDINIKSGFTMDITTNSYKFLPGSQVTVDEGATLKIGSETKKDLNVIFYDEYYDDFACYKSDGTTPILPSDTQSFSYYSKHKSLYDEVDGEFKVKDKYKAKLIVNGTFNCYANVGGIIEASKDTGKVILNSNYAILNKLTEIKYLNIEGIGDIVEAATGMQMGGTVESDTQYPRMNLINKFGAIDYDIEVEKGTYYATEVDGKIGWHKGTIEINYNLNGVSGTTPDTLPGKNSVDGYAVQSGDLPRLTNPYYQFDGWYLDSACSDEYKVEVGKVLYCDVTLYAKWTPNTYKIEFKDVYSFDSHTGNSSLNNTTLDFTHQTYGDFPTIPTHSSSYKHAGWYLDETCLIGSSMINGAYWLENNYLNDSEKVIIYILWCPEGTDVYTVSYINEVKDDGNYSNSQCEASGILLYDVDEQKFNSSLPTFRVADNDPNYKYYFDGWYTEPDGQGTKITSLTLSLFDADKHTTLYGHWLDKYSVTYTYSLNNNSGTAVPQTPRVEWYKPSSSAIINYNPSIPSDGKIMHWTYNGTNYIPTSNPTLSVTSSVTLTGVVGYKVTYSLTQDDDAVKVNNSKITSGTYLAVGTTVKIVVGQAYNLVTAKIYDCNDVLLKTQTNNKGWLPFVGTVYFEASTNYVISNTSIDIIYS